MPIDADGHMIEVETNAPEVSSGTLVTPEERARRHAEAMIDAMLAPGAGKPLMFFHGGLNRVSRATQDADLYVRPMRAEGYHPVLINWDTGFGPAYRKHLIRSTTGRPSTIGNKLTAPASVLWDAVATVVMSPAALWRALGDSARANGLNHRRRWNELLGAVPPCTAPESEHQRMCLVYGELGRENWPTLGDRTGKTLLWSGLAPIRLAFTPVVDRLGAVTWKEMLRNTRNVFNPEGSFSHEQPEPPDSGALAILLRQLVARLDREPQRVPFRMTLIAHSMGAILVDEILRRYLHDPRLLFENIVYLAAASSTRESMHAVHNYLEAHPEAHFYSVMLHPFAEDRERRASTAAPDGSLLVWVDSMFEPSRHFLDRRFGRWENVQPVLPYVLREKGFGRDLEREAATAQPQLAPVRSRMHFTVQGFGDSPRLHNELNRPERRFWCPEYWLGRRITARHCASK